MAITMCWGYNFRVAVARFLCACIYSFIVCTTFIAHAWLDHFELFENESSPGGCHLVCDFLLENLNRTEDGESSASATRR